MALKIQIVNGVATAVLCDSPVKMTFSTWQPSNEPLVQENPLYGAPAPFLQNAGNEKFTESFNVQRRIDDAGDPFVDPFAANNWWRYHQLNCPRNGRLDWIYGGALGTYSFAQAILKPMRLVKQVGVLLTIQYSFIATNLSKTA